MWHITMAGNNNVLADFLVNVLRQDDDAVNIFILRYLRFCRSRIFWKI